MTILIVALLNGKTKDQWKAWVTNRVKNHVGHATPEALPQLYSQNRLTAFKARRAAEEARGKGGRPELEGDVGSLLFKLIGGREREQPDTDSDESDEMDEPFPFPGVGRNGPVTNSLTKLRLNGGAGRSNLGVGNDEDMASESFTAPPHETTPPLKPLPNGTTMQEKPPQFESLPGSDVAPPAVKAEGLMDTSENPFNG